MVDIYTITFVKRGKNRRTIFELLNNGTKTQAELHKESGLYRTHVRRCLVELEAKGLVKCLNPKDRIHKLYQLTAKGKAVILIEENNDK